MPNESVEIRVSFGRTMKRARSLVLVTLALSIYACAAKPPPSNPRAAQEDQASRRIQKRGFAVGLPPNASWYMDMNDQRPDRFVARRKMLGAHYSFFFRAGLSKLAREPKSPADFAELARQDTVPDPTRAEVTAYDKRTRYDNSNGASDTL